MSKKIHHYSINRNKFTNLFTLNFANKEREDKYKIYKFNDSPWLRKLAFFIISQIVYGLLLVLLHLYIGSIHQTQTEMIDDLTMLQICGYINMSLSIPISAVLFLSRTYIFR